MAKQMAKPVFRNQRPMAQTQMILGILLIGCILGFNMFNPNDKPYETLLLASVVVLLGFWPLHQWLGN